MQLPIGKTELIKNILTEEMKTAHGHLMLPQQHLYNGLARPTPNFTSLRPLTVDR